MSQLPTVSLDAAQVRFAAAPESRSFAPLALAHRQQGDLARRCSSCAPDWSGIRVTSRRGAPGTLLPRPAAGGGGGGRLRPRPRTRSRKPGGAAFPCRTGAPPWGARSGARALAAGARDRPVRSRGAGDLGCSPPPSSGASRRRPGPPRPPPTAIRSRRRSRASRRPPPAARHRRRGTPARGTASVAGRRRCAAVVDRLGAVGRAPETLPSCSPRPTRPRLLPGRMRSPAGRNRRGRAAGLAGDPGRGPDHCVARFAAPGTRSDPVGRGPPVDGAAGPRGIAAAAPESPAVPPPARTAPPVQPPSPVPSPTPPGGAQGTSSRP